MSKYRIETDSHGEVKVPNERLYGAQTQRSLENFKIGSSHFPLEVIEALLLIKKGAAIVNHRLNLITEREKALIIEAVDELLKGGYEQEFPLRLYQTGSGTQSNMNVNEVISNLAIKKSGGIVGSKKPIHPNDHVNCSQSSNDTIPTAIHMAVVLMVKRMLLPALESFAKSLKEKQEEFSSIIKIGRTHLMDATPLTFGQEFSGYYQQIIHGIQAVTGALKPVEELAIGGTAVGTGINCPTGFKEAIIELLSEWTKHPFRSATNLFEALSSEDSLVEMSGAMDRIACSVLKIANDIRYYASGPRAGIGELILPSNEPGSSIMPGKVNPTQCEAITMVAARVMGNHTTIAVAASQGQFQLNVYRPVIAHALLQSIELLADAICNFNEKCLKGLKVNRQKVHSNLHNSLMLVTALTPHIGYDKAAKIALYAHEHDLSLKEATLKLNFLTAEQFDEYIAAITQSPPS